MTLMTLSRRELLAYAGCGFGSLALTGLLAGESLATAVPDGTENPYAVRSPHYEPRAKRIIFLYMPGGPSHVDLLDPKPRLAAENGLSMAVHAIGDRANRETLDAYERLRGYERDELGTPDLRHRIEHVQLLHPADAGRLAALNVIASMQPIHATSDMLMADRYWGKRAELAYALNIQLQARARLAFGSDAPVESPNPFLGLHAAVTRRRADGSPGEQGWYPAQRLSLVEALHGFTTGAAYAAGMEDRVGRLAPGCLADLIVLDTDPFRCEPHELQLILPVRTMVGGEWVFRRVD